MRYVRRLAALPFPGIIALGVNIVVLAVVSAATQKRAYSAPTISSAR